MSAVEISNIRKTKIRPSHTVPVPVTYLDMHRKQDGMNCVSNERFLPDSVRGAPEELKPAIRKKQNKEVRMRHLQSMRTTSNRRTMYILRISSFVFSRQGEAELGTRRWSKD